MTLRKTVILLGLVLLLLAGWGQTSVGEVPSHQRCKGVVAWEKTECYRSAWWWSGPL